MKVKPAQGSKLGKILYGTIIILRVIAAPLIFKLPVLSIVLSIVLDIYDGEFACIAGFSKRKYEVFDKLIDAWWYLLILGYSYLFLPQGLRLLSILFIYRIAGIVIFLVSNNEKTLVFFPNLFTRTFHLFFFTGYINGLRFLVEGRGLIISFLVIVLTKIVQEYLMHVRGFSVREDLLNWARPKYWSPKI